MDEDLGLSVLCLENAGINTDNHKTVDSRKKSEYLLFSLPIKLANLFCKF